MKGVMRVLENMMFSPPLNDIDFLLVWNAIIAFFESATI
jgi:hypothetical protein